MLIIRIKDRWNPSGTRQILVGRITGWIKYINFLRAVHVSADRYGVQHAFHNGRSQVTNAMAHIGYSYTMTMRMIGLFESLDRSLMAERLDSSGLWPVVGMLVYKDRAYAGMQSTPALSNIMAAPMDASISQLNRTSRFGRLFVYTRYAEALYFSYNGQDTGTELRKLVPMAARLHGYDINDKFTTVQAAVAGRRIISGIAVDDKLHASRRMKRKLRSVFRRNLKASPGELVRIALQHTAYLMPPKGYVEQVVPLNKVRRRPDPVPASTTIVTPPTTRPSRKFDL